ncbi:MAG: hypothetical protein IPP83_10080 [Flavobacteriales bacterium]|nr:hypothetical protein [Flavobacteriales bacterium]
MLCPDGSGGPAISLQWIAFNLSTAGSPPLDQLSIYDQQLHVGTPHRYMDRERFSGIVSASFANPTGCLTLVFTSNSTGTGVFAAATTCFQPTNHQRLRPPSEAAFHCSGLPRQVIDFDASAIGCRWFQR